MIGGTLETGREYPIEEKVIVSMDRHFILDLAEMKKGVERSRVAVEGGHHEFPRESERGDFP